MKEDVLEDLILGQFFKLDVLEPGTAEYKAVADNLIRLFEIQNSRYHCEVERIKAETEDRKVEYQHEMEIRKADTEDRKVEYQHEVEILKTQKESAALPALLQWLTVTGNLAVDVLGVIAPLRFQHNWFLKGFQFEETGSISSSTFMEMLKRAPRGNKL